MLRRKAYDDLLKWKRTKSKECLLIKGARQIGKTYIVREFGKKEYKTFIEINFMQKPSLKSIFGGELSAEEIDKRISIHFPKENLLKGINSVVRGVLKRKLAYFS